MLNNCKKTHKHTQAPRQAADHRIPPPPLTVSACGRYVAQLTVLEPVFMLHPFHCFSCIKYFQLSLFCWTEWKYVLWVRCDHAGTAVGEHVQPTVFVVVGHSCPLQKQSRELLNAAYYAAPILWCDGKTFALLGSQGLHMLLPVRLFPFWFSIPSPNCSWFFLPNMISSFSVPHTLYTYLFIIMMILINCWIWSLGKTYSYIFHAVNS